MCRYRIWENRKTIREGRVYEMEQQSLFKVVLRWIVFLPAAFLAAWIAWLVIGIANRLTMFTQGIDPDSFLTRAFIEFISNAVMGVAFVYIGAKVAPNHHKIVAYALAGFGLVATGFMMFPAFMIDNYWAVWAGASLITGVGATAYSVGTGGIELES